MKTRNNSNHRKKVRYAVVGLGHIAQAAVLPAFANARKNSELTALISDDPVKRRTLSRQYNVPNTFSYAEYDAALRSDVFDAVYIALPNHLHCDYAVRAARAGIHVLCEKPLALDERECEMIIRACAENNVRLMTAYRLHFEPANLEVIRLLQAGRIGEPRVFQSLFSMQVKDGNIRVKRKTGGGTLYDIGVYCINAARYLFRDEPTDVFAYSARKGEKRFSEIDEMTSAIMRFPGQRLASFTTSFGAADEAVYEVLGTTGKIKVTSAYEYSEPMEMEITRNGTTEKREYVKRDQFGPELIYFSDCVLKGTAPEPSGVEGLLDVHIVRSLYESAKVGRPVKLKALRRRRRPTMAQKISRPAVRKPRQVHVTEPHK